MYLFLWTKQALPSMMTWAFGRSDVGDVVSVAIQLYL